MSKALSITGGASEWNEEKIALLKRTYCKDATNDEFQLFLGVCQRRKLDPFARQIYAVKRWDAQLRREVMTPQISIDGQRLVAERTGRYQGQEGPWWCGEDGVWKEVWLSKEPPAAAKVLVYKRGFEKGIPAVAHFHEYAQTKKDGGLTTMWQARGAGQLAKCAESLALRKAFPEDLSGLYTIEEFPPEKIVEHTLTTATATSAPPMVKTLAELRSAVGHPAPLMVKTLAELKASAVTRINNVADAPFEDTMLEAGHFRGIRLKDRPKAKWAQYRLEIQKSLEDDVVPEEHREAAINTVGLLGRYLGDSEHSSEPQGKGQEGSASGEGRDTEGSRDAPSSG